MVRDGILVEATFPWDPHGLLYSGYWVSFPGESGQGVVLTAQSHLAPRLKKE